MKFRTFGNKNNKSVMLLHGGGLSWWSLQEHIDAIKENYYVIAATIDGHGDDAKTTFTTIETCADKIIEYINSELNNELYAIGGLSIGAQIAVEVLSRGENTVKKALIESALVTPIKMIVAMIKPMYHMSYGLIKQKWFSKYQAKALFVPESMFDSYYEDSMKMSKQSLINMTVSNSSYEMPVSLTKCKTHALILVGSKELSSMKKSAVLLNKTIDKSSLKILDKYGHGEFSLKTPNKYNELIIDFLNK